MTSTSLLKLAPLEERIYRMRCVEGWSVVIPWAGYSLSELLKAAQPTAKAKYVAFETLYDRKIDAVADVGGNRLPVSSRGCGSMRPCTR